ncbi:acyltransferase domain-containing protein [Aliikangiella sp. IMCC44359]|uniref:acyltransferase domain-containing protein n=1 Tax=Aliikangiella sp. IMCC44359 TaxID=3459125 RepID=UPI00403AB0BE
MNSMNVDPESKIVFLFPGQGSQYYQMGRQLYESQPSFAQQMDQLDQYFYDQYGYSLLAELYGSKTLSTPLDNIQYSHPLIVMIEYSIACLIEQNGLVPELLIGSSLGEYAAHAFAGKITIYRALDMVFNQAQWATQNVVDGFLMAVIASRHLYTENALLNSQSYLAGVGFEGAFVLAGERQNIPAIDRELTDLGVAHQVLPVRVPFHSPLVEPMAEHWLSFYADEIACKGRVKVLPQPGQNGGNYAAALWHVVRQPIEFSEQLAQLSCDEPHLLIDVGPGGTLANWCKQSGRGGVNWQSLGVLSPMGEDLSRFEKIIEVGEQLFVCP